MSELRIDVSELKREEGDLAERLASFLKRMSKAKVDIIGEEIVVAGKVASKRWVLRTLIRDFMNESGIKGKIKRGGRNVLKIVKDKGKPIFCDRNGAWKAELEERLSKGGEIVLLALGSVKYQVLAYLNRRRDIEIIELEARRMKKREKGTGLKAIIRSLKHTKTP